MKRNKIHHIFILLFTIFFLTACGKEKNSIELPTVDPHEGMVEVSNGVGGYMWVPAYDALPVCTYDSQNIVQDGAFLDYEDEQYTALRGIDVSFYQKEIDWNLVKQDGIDFAMIRVGYRGYTAGTIEADATYIQNIEGAVAAGIQVGVYFFSQAISPEEAKEEAQFVLDAIAGYPITMPVAFDWERIDDIEGARTDDVTGTVLTECALAFCQVIQDAGYEPAVYFYRRLGYYEYNLEKIQHLKFWVAAVGDEIDFYYDHYMWQYSFTGKVSGIEEDVDLNLCFEKKK